MPSNTNKPPPNLWHLPKWWDWSGHGAIFFNYSTRKLKSPKWEIDHTETYFHQSKNPRMEGLVIMNCFAWHSRFFYLGLFGGFKNFCDEGTSRWAILPPSDLLSFIDFLFHHSQIYLFQFNEILSMNVK